MDELEERSPARRVTGEIIPPDQRAARSRGDASGISIVIGRDGTRRIRVTKLRPFEVWLVALVFGVLGALTLFVIVSTALLWAVLIGALAAAVILVQSIRAYFRRS